METGQAEAKTQYRLLILGDGTVRTVSLSGTRWIVGRAEDCSIVLRDPTVSRRHLLLERHGDQFRCQDLGGSNPPTVDGRPIRDGNLAIGTTLTLGLTRLVIERRSQPQPIAAPPHPTVVLSREVVDHEAGPGDQTSPLLTAARILDRIEWTFADLGDLAGAAEPLLTLAMNLTGRDAAWLGRFGPRGDIETLATLATRPELEIRRLPATVLTDARRINQPHLLTTREHEGHNHRLVVPLGNAPEGLLVLEAPQPGAPSGQELLRLASSLGAVVWHRLQETTERLRLRDELERLRFHGSGTHHALLASARLQALREALRNLSSSDDPVLLIGEEGTEREELARYRHAESTRQQAPFVSWNASRCAAGRHAEELFGSDATTGLWQQAAAGTLLIDHAGLLSIAVQRQLARALQRRHGDAPGPSLVLAATPTTPLVGCPELLAACREPLLIPPLRTDARDILALAELFLSELGSGPDGSPRLLSERSKRLLVAYPWPGNVRELRLVLESASAQAGGQPISPRHLPPSIANDPTAGTADVPTLEAVERQHILDVMQRTGGNRTRAAQLLGIANSTLYEKLKRYCIEP